MEFFPDRTAEHRAVPNSYRCPERREAEAGHKCWTDLQGSAHFSEHGSIFSPVVPHALKYTTLAIQYVSLLPGSKEDLLCYRFWTVFQGGLQYPRDALYMDSNSIIGR